MGARGPERRDSIEVEGARELRKYLKAAGDDLADLKDAHLQVAELVADEARTLAPRRSGALAGSIRAAGQGGKALVRVGSKKVPYANPIYYGWPRRGIRENKFIKRAAENVHEKALALYVEHLQKILDQIKGAE